MKHLRKPSKEEYKLSFIFVIIVMLGGLTVSGMARHAGIISNELMSEERSMLSKQIFLSTNLIAKSAYVYDVTDKSAIFALRQNEILPLASLTKIMTALVVASDLQKDEIVKISSSAIKEQGESNFKKDEVWSVTDLTSIMLLSSSNDAARAIREYYEHEKGENSFIKRMNEYGKEIGLSNTIFNNESGLDNGNTLGATGTSIDVSTMLVQALRAIPQIIGVTARPIVEFRSIDGTIHNAENTNDLSLRIEGLVASKTGYTYLAGGNLAVAYRVPVYGHTIIVVILGSTLEGRFSDMKLLVDAVNTYFRSKQ